VTEHGEPGDDSYVVRKTGIQRFDKRNAGQLLHYTLDLLQDESAAFSSFGREYVQSIIKELNQNMAALQQRLKSSSVSQADTVYLFVKPKKAGESITIDYWTSNGTDANGFRPGSKLHLYSGASFYPDQIQLLTMTTGGRGELAQDEMVEAYRFALLSQERIVSAEDIKAACRYILGSKVKEVEVKQGFTMGALTEQGLAPVTDVVITPHEKIKLAEEEWRQLSEDVLLKLKTHSMPHIQYRVRIENRA
jgi:hypothetical protein